MIFLIIFTIAIGILIYYASRPYRERHLLPPGPMPLPFLGNILEFRGSKKSSFEDALTLMKKYGDDNCVTIWFGNTPSVFINTMDGIRQAFIDNQHDFASRPDMDIFEFFFEGGVDIIMGKYTAQWASNKKVGSRLVRRVIETGKLESNVIEAVDTVLDEIRAKGTSEAIDLVPYTTNIVYNILTSLCFGVRLATDDPMFKALLALRDRQNNAPIGLVLLMFVPGVAYFEPLLHYYPPYKEALDDSKMQLNFIQDFIDKHRSEYPEKKASGQQMDDILYAMLAEQEAAEKSGDEEAKISDITAKLIVFDIFAAGTETTAATLSWFVTELAANPDIQEECARAVAEVVGDGVPNLEDRPRLPLVEAVIIEILRLHPVGPLAAPHTPSRQGAKLFNQYEVPMDTLLQYNIYAVQRDPKLFKDPTKFDPYRHIEDGQCVKPTGWVPFGVGRRICMGEQLAKNDIFLACTSLLQKLKFSPEKGTAVKLDHDVSNGMVNLPQEQKFVVTFRK